MYGPKIIIGISKRGVDFDSLDNKPTYVIFLLLSDSEVVHLRIMAKLTGILRERDVISKLKKLSTPKAVIQFFINHENREILSSEGG